MLMSNTESGVLRVSKWAGDRACGTPHAFGYRLGHIMGSFWRLVMRCGTILKLTPETPSASDFVASDGTVIPASMMRLLHDVMGLWQ
jgi:hypothetical protein